MLQYRCKCGESTYFGSGMAPHDCEGCDKCNTTYAFRPVDHKERKPHDYKKQYNVNTGELSHYICKVCYERKNIT